MTLAVRLVLVHVLVLVLVLPASGQGRSAPPTPTLDAVAWLAGSWEGAVGDDPLLESWFPPADGKMVGLFRWVKEGEVFLYELMSLEETAEGLVLKIKHFGADLAGWEEKGEAKLFDLVEVAGDGRAVFAERGDEVEHTRVTYRPDGEGAMVATFEETRNGQPVVLTFRYERR